MRIGQLELGFGLKSHTKCLRYGVHGIGTGIGYVSVVDERWFQENFQ